MRLSQPAKTKASKVALSLRLRKAKDGAVQATKAVNAEEAVETLARAGGGIERPNDATIKVVISDVIWLLVARC